MQTFEKQESKMCAPPKERYRKQYFQKGLF